MPRQLGADQATSKQCPQNTSSQGAAGLKSCPTSQSGKSWAHTIKKQQPTSSALGLKISLSGGTRLP